MAFFSFCKPSIIDVNQFNVLDIYFQREAEVDVVPEADAPAVSREEGRSCKRTS
jgi:hypothetical protein